MITSPRGDASAEEALQSRPTLLGLALLCALAYMVLIGGTVRGETDAGLRLINGLIGGALIVLLVLKAPSKPDALDRAAIAALLLFAVAGLMSAFLRQSFDAVLAALAFTAGLSLARGELRSPGSRRRFVTLFMTLSVIITLIFTARWLVPIFEWWAGTDWKVIPPLNFELGGSPWGHRHDLALLVAVLYPAWWIGRPSLVRRAFAIAFGVLGILIVLVDGSRAIWLGLGVATAIVALPAIANASRKTPAATRLMLGLLLLLALASVATGVGSNLIQRALNPATLDYRAAMWGSIAQDWLTHPIAGNGPGSFPWVLQLTDYFNTNSHAPRHPDSAVFQVIAEAGLLGLAGMLSIVAMIGFAIVRTKSSAAQWALLALAVAALTANPTDFAFLVVVGTAWLAYAYPRAAALPRPGRIRRSPAQAASVVCLSVIGVAFACGTIAANSYERARGAAEVGALGAAVQALDSAIELDPAMALYWRQRGAVHYLRSEFGAAIPDLERATRLNGADDLTWRTLALARLAAGDGHGADEALRRAVALQRSDPTNLLLTAVADAQAGRADAAAALLAESAQAWPSIVFAEGWTEVLPMGTTTTEVLRAAMSRWVRAEPIPERETDQGIWLAAMIGDPTVIETAVDQSLFSRAIGEALAAAVRCEPTTDRLSAMAPDEQKSFMAWWLRAQADILEGGSGEKAAHMAARMGHPVSPAVAGETLNPLDENGLYSADRWGYRRLPIEWPEVGLMLPSPSAGLMRWLLDTRSAVDDANLDGLIPACVRGGAVAP